jgi:hypothetical protein
MNLLDVLKIDFGEVDEAMFRVVEMSSQLIFWILDIWKSDLKKVA